MATKGGKQPEGPSRWLRYVRKRLDMGQAEFAEALGVSRTYYSNIERGERRVTDDLVRAVVARFPEAPKPEQFEKAETSNVKGFSLPFAPEMVEIPYAGIVPASTWGDPLETQEYRAIEAKYAGKNRFLATVLGDSCYPSLRSADLTLWEAQSRVKSIEPHGLIVLAERLEDHACTVKKFEGDSRTGRLLPINPNYGEPTAPGGFRIGALLVGVFRTEGIERSWYWPGGLRPSDLFTMEQGYEKETPSLPRAAERRKPYKGIQGTFTTDKRRSR